VREGDLFTAVDDKQFDIILFNPPYLYGKPQDNLDRAFHAEDVIERFVRQLPQHLKSGGYVLLLLSSTGDESHFLDLFRQQACQIETVAQKQLPTEVISLYKIVQRNAVPATLYEG
jgi:methylase of polypeptide subunit release factors